MLNIPETVKALYKRDGVRKNFRAHFPNGELPDITNENLVQESVKFTESVCSQDIFKFGLTEASVIEFETVGVANMYGMTIECSNEIDCSSLTAEEISDIEAGTWDGEFVTLADSDLGYAFFRVPYGVFTVDNCPRNHEAMAHRKVTAYSASFDNLSLELPMLPTELPAASMLIDPLGFIAQAEPSLLNSYQLRPIIAKAGTIHLLYDSTGKQYNLYFYGAAEGKLHQATTLANDPDFVSINDSYDIEANLAFGNAVADYITNLGYDLTYTADKRKAFSDNREALKRTAPWLFAPCFMARGEYFVSGSGTSYARDPTYSILLKPNTIYPIAESGSRTTAAFKLEDLPLPNPTPMGQVFGAVLDSASTSSNPRFRLFTNDSSVDVTFAYPAPVPDLTNVIFTGYKLTTQSPYKLRIYNTGRLPDLRTKYGDTAKNIRMYSFENAFDRIKLVNGSLEINASFGKVNRSGEMVTYRLDNSSPVPISPGEYSQAWWDEYEVLPVGSVAYNIQSGEDSQTSVFQFGEGQSVYDMTDNDVLSLMETADVSIVETILTSTFVPYIGAVNFVPIDLECKGLPYLEAGDAVTLTAEDGTTVQSYIMRHEINGIQALSSTIESTSGSIIGSEITT